jgi:hypothetical protein
VPAHRTAGEGTDWKPNHSHPKRRYRSERHRFRILCLEKEQTTGAKAPSEFELSGGTSELVPFPIVLTRLFLRCVFGHAENEVRGKGLP